MCFHYLSCYKKLVLKLRIYKTELSRTIFMILIYHRITLIKRIVLNIFRQRKILIRLIREIR